MVSHPGFIFFLLWMVSHPGHGTKIMQEEEVQIYDVHSSMFTLLSGAARDPGHSTKIMRGGRMVLLVMSISEFASD